MVDSDNNNNNTLSNSGYDNRYINRYYNKGGFYLDSNETSILLNRDYSAPTESDRATDKLLLPKIMQKHGIGLKSHIKHKTLNEQDTTKNRLKL